MRGISGTQDCGGINSMHIVKKKKKSVSQSTVTTHQKKKTMLGPQEQDRLKVIMNNTCFSCHNLHRLNFSGEGRVQNDL